MQTSEYHKLTDSLPDVATAIQDGERNESSPKQSRIWTGAFIGLSEMLQEQGVDYEAILAEAGLTPAMLEERTTFVPMEAYVRVLDLAAKHTGDPDFALHYGERFPPGRDHVWVYVYSNAPTLKAGIEAAVRYSRLVVRIPSSFSLHKGIGCFEFSSAMSQAMYIHKNCIGMVRRLKLIQKVVGTDWKPLEAGFAHGRPDNISEYIRLFGENIVFDQPTNSIKLDAGALETPMPEADPGLFEVLRSYCEQLLKEYDRGDDPLQTIRTFIVDNLSGGLLSPADVATGTGLEIDELKSILKSRNISFRDLQDELRKGLAARYLTETDLRCGEIAFLLGFSEQSALTRASKRWFGVTPLEFRRAPCAQ